MWEGFVNNRALLPQKIFVAKYVCFVLCKQPALSVFSPLKLTLSPIMGLKGPAHLMECLWAGRMNDSCADNADKICSSLRAQRWPHPPRAWPLNPSPCWHSHTCSLALTLALGDSMSTFAVLVCSGRGGRDVKEGGMAWQSLWGTLSSMISTGPLTVSSDFSGW